MTLTRRTLLQAAGASGAAATAAGPGGFAAVAGARETALLAGKGPYLVVGDKGVLKLCTSYHDAVHHASLLRHTSGVQAYHVRCTPTLMQQLQSDPGSLWVDVDGLAVTPNEAETRAFEFLRRARNPHETRKRLWNHHLAALRETVELEDLSDPGTCWYVTEDGRVITIAENREQLDEISEGQLIHACTPELSRALENYLKQRDEKPEINASYARRMTVEEYETRLRTDVRFRIACAQPEETRVPLSDERAGAAVTVQLDLNGHWLFPYLTIENQDRSEPHIATVSAHLGAVLQSNGFAMPGFWRTVDGVLHHLDEFADTVPMPTLGNRTVRHQNRHT